MTTHRISSTGKSGGLLPLPFGLFAVSLVHCIKTSYSILVHVTMPSPPHRRSFIRSTSDYAQEVMNTNQSLTTSPHDNGMPDTFTYYATVAKSQEEVLSVQPSPSPSTLSTPSSLRVAAATSYANKFAIYCTISTIVMIAFLSAACEMSQTHADASWMSSSLDTRGPAVLDEIDMNGAFSVGGETMSMKLLFKQYNHINSNNIMRRLTQLEREEDSSRGACGDIFLFVKNDHQQRQERVSTPLMKDSQSTQLYDRRRSEEDSIPTATTKTTTTISNEIVYNQRLCQYAQTCDGGLPSRVLLPFILCHGIDMSYVDGNDATTETTTQPAPTTSSLSNKLQSIFIYLLLPPLLLLYLLLLFRLLSTTADHYFSPALETFSFELGLPPRFAGATLLALGNGSPDLGSTVNAILLWNEDGARAAVGGSGGGGGGWTMSLGSLSGGGMFVGTIVCGLIVQNSSGIPCRGAFLRDVIMYAFSVFVVWQILESGNVTRHDVWLLLGMWLAYVSLIFCADMYHRKVTLPRLQAEGKKRRESIKIERIKRLSRASELIKSGAAVANEEVLDELSPLMMDNATYGERSWEPLKDGALEATDIETTAPSTDSTSSVIPRRPRLSVGDRFAMLMSNYDPASVKFDISSRSSTVSNDSEGEILHNLMHNFHTINRSSLILSSPKEEGGAIIMKEADESQHRMPQRLSSFPEELDEESIIDEGRDRACSIGLFADVYQELVFQTQEYCEKHYVDEPSRLERFGFILELPFTIIRTVS